MHAWFSFSPSCRAAVPCGRSRESKTPNTLGVGSHAADADIKLINEFIRIFGIASQVLAASASGEVEDHGCQPDAGSWGLVEIISRGPCARLSGFHRCLWGSGGGTAAYYQRD